VRLNSTYLKDLLVPEVEKLYAERARFDRLLPIDAARFLDTRGNGSLVIDDIVWQLFNRRHKPYDEKYLPHLATLRQIAYESEPQRQADVIWSVFEDRVDLASLYLHALRRDDFVFYRKMDIEEAIFESLDALSGGYPELDFEFSAVPANGRAEYEQLNNGLQRFASLVWPDDPARYLKLMLLLYWVLPELTRPETTLRRYWLGMAKDPANVEEIKSLPLGATTEWSATYQVEEGDYYLVYCTRPTKGIAAIFRAVGRAWCDPTGGWKGHWVTIEKVADGLLSLDAMRTDDTLRDWGPAMSSFQGTVLTQVSPRVFNRIREVFVEQGMPPRAVEPAPLDRFYAAGQYAKEKDFEEQCIEPLLRDLGFGEYKRQYLVRIWAGCEEHKCKIDYLVRDDKGRVTLFEDKKEIKAYRHVSDAYHQARSYALLLGLRSFVLAAPEGLRLYGRRRTESDFPLPDDPLFEMAWPEVNDAAKVKEFKSLLLLYASKDGRAVTSPVGEVGWTGSTGHAEITQESDSVLGL